MTWLPPNRGDRPKGGYSVLGAVVLLAALLVSASVAGAQSTPNAPDVVAWPGDQSVTLVWQPVHDGGSRIIRWEYRQILPLPAGVWVPVPDSGPRTTAHTVTGLANGTPYRFEVRAVTFAGNGAPGASRASTGNALEVVPSTAPAAPRGLRATAGNSQIELSWTAAVASGPGRNDGYSPITAYEYRQKTGNGDYTPWTIVIGSGPASTGHMVSGLANGTTYQFQIRARNANGAGAAAETPPVLVAAVPGPPRGLSGRAGYRSAILTWAPSSDGGAPITGWQYRQGTGSADIADGVAWVAIPDSHAHTTSHIVFGLDNIGRQYRFEVRAANEVGPGIAGATGVIDPGSVPSRPISLTATLNEGAGDTATLAWRRPPDGNSPITGYQYAVRAGSGAYGPWQDIPGSGPQTMSHEVGDLMGRTAYWFRVRAVNAVGGGAVSTITKPIHTGTAPSAPQSLTVSNSYDAAKGTRHVTLRWRPGDDGGSPVTRWEYKYAAAGDLSSFYGDQGWVAVCDSATVRADAGCGLQSSVTVPRAEARLAALGVAAGTGGPELVPVAGETYHVIVRAVNEHGTGSWSGTAATTIPRIVPTTPSAVYIRDADDDSFRVWWPASTDGGANTEIPGTDIRLRYQLSYRVGGAPWTEWANTDTNTATISDAEAGERYQVRVRAENAVGHGGIAESEAYTHGAPPSPGAHIVDTEPSITAEAAVGQVTLSLEPRGGGGNIGGISGTTRWEYAFKVGSGEYSSWLFNNFGSWFANIIVDFLEDGEPHTFRIRGANGQYPGPSVESETVYPGGGPLPPVGLLATGGDGQVTLTWTSRGGGPPITKWQVCELNNANPCRDVDTGDGWADIADSGPETTSHTVEDLANGTAYTFLVRAWNAAGRGERAQAGPATPGKAPEPPALVQATAGDGEINVIVTVPGNEHGSPVTSYQIRKKVADAAAGAYDDWQTVSRDGTQTSTTATVAGVVNGITYTLEVRARNAYGPGEAATALPVTPLGPPPAAVVRATPFDSEVLLFWVSGGDGGSAVTGWEYRVAAAGDDFGAWTDIPGGGDDITGHLVAGLRNGTAYTFEVRAVNTFGPGEAGRAGPVTPATTPAAPSVTAAGGRGEITVSWTPGGDGGSAVIGWHYRVRAGVGDYGQWIEAAADARAVTITDLSTGTGVLSYTVQVRATNGVGEGAAGTSNEAAPVEGAPTEETPAEEEPSEEMPVDEPVEVPPANGEFYSGVITGPEFCANLSLGGARLFAHDDDKDGVADVCALPHTRREAIARQRAVDALVNQYPGEYAALVNEACASIEGEAACGGDGLSAPPRVPINDGGAFYSGVITGPSFCANRSLGGPTTYPHDDDKDGVADVCALPYTRREAIARQQAGDTLAATHPADFRRELASACRGLTGGDYGDDPEDLDDDACA